MGSTKNSGCFQLRPEKRLYIWPSLSEICLRPEKRAFLWPLPAQSMRSEPFAAARTACFEQLAGVFVTIAKGQVFRIYFYEDGGPRNFVLSFGVKDLNRGSDV